MNYLLTLLETIEGQTKLVGKDGYWHACEGLPGVQAKINSEFVGAYPDNALSIAAIQERLIAGSGVAAFRMGPKLVGVVTEMVEKPQ